MSADPHLTEHDEHAEAQAFSPAMPDMSALDAALRDVFSAQRSPTPEPAVELDQTIEVVSRAASAIDELVERNRAITDAAVRSVEFFRVQVNESRAEAERLREELAQLKDESEAQRVAARVHAEELESELALRTAELEQAKAWIAQIRSEVESLLGNAESKLGETADLGFLDQ